MSFRSIALLSIKIFTLSLLLLASPFSHAQNYPVQVNVNVATPCPVRLSSLFPGASSRVNLMMLLTDISQPELQVRLRVTLEGPGLTLTTRPEFLPIPFTLYGGMPVSLQTELAPYFTTSSLMASGSAAVSFAQSGMLPEGMYKLTVQAIEHRRNVVVSNTAMAMVWAIYNDPPEPIQPMNNQVVDAGSIQNMLFTWAPCHILTPGAGGQIGYTLSLWEVPQGVNPELVVQTLPAIGTIESYSPTAIWGPDRPMLIPGKQYAYRIQATDPTGEVAFKNSGNSVVRAFTFGTPCSKPVNLSHSEVTIQSARTAWVPMGNVSNFAVEYRPALEEPVNWRSYEVQGSTTTLSSLAPATEYKYRVKSVCGSYQSDPTAEKSFTTLPLPNLDNLCTGDAVAPPVVNAPLLDNLAPLQVISAGGFLVTIDEVTRTAPYTFSGKGRIAMPLFSTNVKGTFKNIQVNSLLQLTAGKVESVKSETLTIVGGNGSNPNGPGAVDFGNITDTIHITSPIDTVYMNPDSTWTVVTTNGGTVIVTPPADGTGVLVLDPNGNGVVITSTGSIPYSRENNNGNVNENEEEPDSNDQVPFFAGYNISVNLEEYLPIKNDTISCKVKFTQKPNDSYHIKIMLKDKKQIELLNSINDIISPVIDTSFYDFKFVCKEYWSYGKIEVFIENDSINVDTLSFEVPIDVDNDYIADYWELLPVNGANLSLGGNTQDGDWDDEVSRNCPNNGDGFTKMDEYMGYTWNNIHRRLSPIRKEVFFNSSMTNYGNFIRKEFATQLDVDTVELNSRPLLLFCGVKLIQGIEIQDKTTASSVNNGIFIQNSIPSGHGPNITFGQCRGNKGNALVEIYVQTYRNVYQNNSISENFKGSFTFPIADISGFVIYEAVYDSTDMNGNGNNTDLINPFDLLSPKNAVRPNTKADNDPIDSRIIGIDLNTAIENNVIHEAGHAVGMAPGNAHPATGYSPMRSGIGPAHNDTYSTNDINQFILK